VPRRRAAPAARDRGDLDEPDRPRERAPHRLARRGGATRRSVVGVGDGPGARGVLRGVVGPQGCRTGPSPWTAGSSPTTSTR
jgi:hypothetical protein